MKRDKITLILSVILAGMCTLAGCGSLKKITINDITQKIYPVSGIAISDDEAKKMQDKIPIHLYYADKENKLKLLIRYIPKTEENKNIGNIATTIFKELMKKPEEQGLRTTIPNGTKLNKDITVGNNIAYIDLSEEFINNHTGGKIEEQLTIFSIVNSLTEVEGINGVHFKVNGRSKKEYKGNFKFDNDFARGLAILKK